MSRRKGSAELIEARRQALHFIEQGHSLNEVGRMVGVAPSSVMRWRNSAQAQGESVLNVRYSCGRPPALNAAQRKELVERLLKGAVVNGFSTEVWTTARVGTLIYKHFHVDFHRSHVTRLLHALGFRCWLQRRALESNDAPTQEREHKDCPGAKRKPRGWLPASCLSTSRPDSDSAGQRTSSSATAMSHARYGSEWV